MPLLDWLLKTGSIANSLGFYIPAMTAQKVLGVLRTLLLTWLLAEAGYGLWALAAMLLNVLAMLLPLGSNEGIARYVSYYEARGHLQRFYRRLRWSVLTLCVGMACLALLVRAPLAGPIFHAGQGEPITDSTARAMYALAVVNALAMALYYNLRGFLVGLRLYRVISLLELVFGLAFTGMAAGGLLANPHPQSVLWAHLLAVTVTLLTGGVFLHAGVARYEKPHEPLEPAEEGSAMLMEPTGEQDGGPGLTMVALSSSPPQPQPPEPDADEGSGRMFQRVLRYGGLSLTANLLWLVVGYIGLFMTSTIRGHGQAGVYAVFAVLAQSILAMVNAAWVVVFTHIARRWEKAQRRTAMFVLEMAYKAVVIAAMSLAVLTYALAPVWTLAVGEQYRPGVDLLGGLLMFYLAQAQLGLLTILAKIHERPAVIAATAALGSVAIYLLCLLWVPQAGNYGAAQASGVGMFLAGMVVAALYFLRVRARFQPRTYLLMLSPTLFLLPVRWAWVLALAWLAVALSAWKTRLWFTRQEKELLGRAAAGMLRRARGRA